MITKHIAQVAIITRTKDRPLLLPRAIQSVLNQSFQNWVHIIINDGGNREGVEVLFNQYKNLYQGRLSIFHHEYSKGMEAASNYGIDSSNSQYIVVHDDDDSWHPDFLQKTVSFMENQSTTSIKGVISYIETITEEIEDNTIIELERKVWQKNRAVPSIREMTTGNIFPPIAFLFARSVFNEIGGGFREDLPVLGDWEFNLRFIEKYEIGVVPQILAYYHHRSKGKKTSYSNTVVEYEDLHHQYCEKLKNEFLRRDLKQGKLGIGYLMNYTDFAESQLSKIEKSLNEVKVQLALQINPAFNFLK